MNNMTPEQRVYHAAIIDGEGCISLRSETKSRKFTCYSPHIGVTNTNILLLDYLRKTSGIGVIDPKNSNNPRAKVGYTWRLFIGDMSDYLNQIYDYLIIKQDQAYYMLDYLKLEKGNRHHQPSDDILISRNAIHSILKELNRRGT